MPTVKAGGYSKAVTSAQAGQIVFNRSVWDTDVRAAADKVLMTKLPAGHRLIPELFGIHVNGNVPAGNLDVCVGADANVLLNDYAITASTAARSGVAAGVGAYTLAETLGVDYTQDRDVYLLINSGFATAPAGSKVIVTLASAAVASPD